MRPNSRLLSLAVMALSPSARAALYYWDGGSSNIATVGDGVSQGGSGSWNSTLKNWDVGAGQAHAAWFKRHTAVFGGTAGTVSLTSNLTAAGIIFNTDGYVVGGGSLLTLNSGGIQANSGATISASLKLGSSQSWTVAVGKLLTVSGTVDNNGRLLTITGAGNTSISGVISGTGGLTKTGTGLLTLSGANTFTGITTIAGGILNLGIGVNGSTSGPLGKPTTTAGTLLLTGGTLQYSATNATDYSNRFSTTGGQTWNIDTNGRNVTYATILSGSSSFTKLGAGTLTLSAANTFTGGTTISAGTLNVTGNLATAGAVTVAGGTYTVGVNNTIGALTLASGTINGTGNLSASSYAVQQGSVSAALGGSGALVKSTADTVTLSGQNAYSGGTTINAGTLNVTGSLSNTGSVRVAGGTYTVGSSDTIGALTLASGTINGTGTLTASSYAVESGTISAALAGSGNLTKTTGGTVTLSGTHVYTGATSITAGRLVVDGTLAAGSAVSVAGGTILSGSGTVAGTVTVANNGMIVVGNGSNGTLNIGNLTFTSAGTIMIGTLGNYTANPALNVSGNLVLSGATGAVALELPAGAVSAGTYRLIGSSFSNISQFSVTGATIGVRQTASLVQSGTSINYVVAGANPYWTGAIGSEWSTAQSASLTNWALAQDSPTDFITKDAVLFDDRASSTTVSIAANVNPNIVSFTNATKNYLLQGAGGIASGSLTKSGAGTVEINTTNSYAAGTTLYSGVIKVGNNSALGSGYLQLSGGTISSNSTTSRTLANSVVLGGNVVLGDTTNNGSLNLSGPVNLGSAVRQFNILSDVTLSGVISNGGLTKTGAGTLSLTGANTYAGGTILTGGTLALNSATSLGDASGALTFAGDSSVRFNSSFSLSRGYTINSGVTATLDTIGFSLTQSGNISGAGNLNKTGSGVLTLSGNNTYTGGTTVSAGTLVLSGGSAIANTVSVTVANVSGATLQLNSNATIGSLAGGGTTGGAVNLQSHTLTVGNSLSTTYSGVISGTGSLVKTGSGSLTLTENNQHTGPTTISGGILSISAGSALGAVPASATPGQLVLNGGTLATTATFELNSNRGITTGGTISVATGTTLTYGGIAAGTGTLTKAGTGTLLLTGANTHTGATTVTAGNLAVNGSITSAVTVAGDAILSGTGTISNSVNAQDNANIMAGNGTSGSLSITGALTFEGDGIIQIGTLSNYTSTAALRITGNLGSLDTVGSIVFSLPTGPVSMGTYQLASYGTLSLPQQVSFNTTFSASGPTLGARQSAVLQTNTSKLVNYVVFGDTPYWTGAAGSAWNTTDTSWKLIAGASDTKFLASDVVLFNDTANGTSGATIGVNIASDVNPAFVTFNNSDKHYTLGGSAGIATGALAKNGTGTLTINNANTYSGGTTLNNGTIALGNNAALGVGLLTLNGGTLRSSSTDARAISNSVLIGGNVTLGDATLNGGLTLSGGVDLGGSNRQISAASDVVLSGVISNGGLTKAGTGTMTLTGANTYTGATSVTAGRLVVNGSLANSTLTVASGATLGGSGTIAGTTIIQSGGIHAPGNSPGFLTHQNLSYDAGSIFSWEIDRNLTQSRGIGYDAVNVSGTLSGQNAIFRIVIGDNDFSGTFWSTPRTWNDIFTRADGSTIITNWAGIFSGGFQFFNTSGNAIAAPTSGGFTLAGNSLTWSAVPEPSSALAGLLIAAGLLRRRR